MLQSPSDPGEPDFHGLAGWDASLGCPSLLYLDPARSGGPKRGTTPAGSSGGYSFQVSRFTNSCPRPQPPCGIGAKARDTCAIGISFAFNREEVAFGKWLKWLQLSSRVMSGPLQRTGQS